MTDTAQIAAALAKFQAEMPTVAKKQTANIGTYSYSYADLADVCEAALPLLTKQGIAFTALPKVTDRGIVLRGVLLHESGERLKGSLPITGGKPQDIGSSLTYARRYLFGCMTGIVTDNDDDGRLAQRAATRHTEVDPNDHWNTPDKPLTDKTRRQLFALFGQKGIAEADQLAGVNSINGTTHESRSLITEGEALRAIAVLKTKPDAEVA